MCFVPANGYFLTTNSTIPSQHNSTSRAPGNVTKHTTKYSANPSTAPRTAATSNG